MAQQANRIRAACKPRHACVICGVTNLTDPSMGFRYCSKCAGTPCYCDAHIRVHEHATAGSDRDSVEARS